FEPYRIERDLLADPLALHVAPEQIVGKDGDQGTEQGFQHQFGPSRGAVVSSSGRSTTFAGIAAASGISLAATGLSGSWAACGDVSTGSSRTTDRPPAIRPSEAAIDLNGDRKSGRSIIASKSAAIQKIRLCVNRAISPSTATTS